jgi:DmsE family decaheme c-type cytochrome
MRRVKTFGVAVFLFVVAILFNWPSLSVTVRPPVTLNVATVSAAAPSEDATRYIGSEACAECHVNEASHFAVTAHRKNLSAPASSYDRRGCEACHGGARDHVAFQKQAAQLFKDGKDTEATALLSDETKSKASRLIDLRQLSSSAAAAICLKCHEGEQGRSEERFNFRRSEHARHGVSCLDCHSSHSPKRTEFLLRASQPEMCYKCHQDQKTSFSRPFHHKVPEGAMKCSDCHNQHGSFVAKQLRGWGRGDVTCIKCHSDKAGPFVYEHAPIKVEGCQACHMPHGSTNPRLLIRSEVRFLCLECHSNTPGIPAEGSVVGPPTPNFHNITQARFQNCTVCHSQIHGSNTSSTYFR